VVIGWVIFRAENLDVAWRMYAAMFSFSDWRLSELTLAQLTSLQVATLVLAYLVMAWCGLRQFYRFGAPKAPGTAAACAVPVLPFWICGCCWGAYCSCCCSSRR